MLRCWSVLRKPFLVFSPGHMIVLMVLIARVKFGQSQEHQFSSVAQSCLILCDPMDCGTPPGTCSNSCSIESMMPSNHLILCRPLLLLPSVFHSIRVFSSELVLHIRWPKYQRFSISPSNEYSGLISSRTDWLDLFAVQGTLKIFSKHSSKASILQCSDFLQSKSHIHT